MITMSGSTFSHWCANRRPVRPSPDWISSRISSTLCRLQISSARLRYPAGGMMMPASPWMGSTRNAAVFGVMAASSAAASPKGMTLNPGVSGPNPSLYWAALEKLMRLIVRPWKLPWQAMISA